MERQSCVEEDGPIVQAITVTRGGPSAFLIASSGRSHERVVSSSLCILNTLLPALISGAKPVKVDLVPDTIVIKRVNMFNIGKGAGPFKGEFAVTRIATMLMGDGTGEHLEVELTDNNNVATAYNVYNSFLAQILVAAFGGGKYMSVPSGTDVLIPIRIDVKLDAAKEIETVTIGNSLTLPS